MFAILAIGGTQTIVQEKDVIYVNKVKDVKDGDTITLDKVLGVFSEDGKKVEIGNPYVTHTVSAKVLKAEELGEKVVGAKFKRRKRYTRIFGHRQTLTKLEIGKIGGKEKKEE